MREWCKRHAGALAMVFGAATVVLAVVVCFQAAMLHTRGWRVALGTVSEYLAATGSLATFGVVWFAAGEWNRAQRERRDVETGQARLTIVEHVPHADGTFGLMDPPPPGRRDVLIRNHSGAPIFDLHIEEHPTGHEGVRVFQNSARGGRVRPADFAVLCADETTERMVVLGNDASTPSTECVEFQFTDACGLRWRRLGSAQPERVLG